MRLARAPRTSPLSRSSIDAARAPVDGARASIEAGGVRFTDVDLVRRDLVLLASFSAEVAPGSTLAVMGASGAGKTTLASATAGLVATTAGDIVRPAGGVAVVFQEPRLLPWRSALRNVEIVLDRHDRGRAREWLERVGLGDALDVFPAALSGGMAQRVSIARALAREAPVVIVDEPFSHLDDRTACRLRDELSGHLRARDATVVWVTHDASEAAAVAERTLVMAGPPHGRWAIVDHDDSATLDVPARVTAELARLADGLPDAAPVPAPGAVAPDPAGHSRPFERTAS